MARVFLLLGILLASLGTLPAADVGGTWIFDVQLDAGSGSPTFEFKQAGERLTGTYHGQLGEAPIEGTVKGDKIRFAFKVSAGGDSVEVVYEGVVEGSDAMKGRANYGNLASGTWTGKRKK